jgi:hypothetical protein
MTPPRHRSKLVATWLAVLAGSFGVHRFYLHGLGDRWGWLFPLPTLAGLYGVLRMRALGGDDLLPWFLIPWLGVTITAGMLSALVYGLTPDAAWSERYNPGGAPTQTGWATIIGVILALSVGAAVAIATIAFTAQRVFEYQQLAR